MKLFPCLVLVLLCLAMPACFAHEGQNDAFSSDGDFRPSEVEVDEQAVAALGIKTSSAKPGTIDDILKATGEVKAAETNSFDVTAPVSGSVRAVLKKQNDTVRKGESLGLIHSIEVAQTLSGLLVERTKIKGEIERVKTQYGGEITLQEKEVQLAKAEYERQESLFKEGIAAKKAYQESQGEYEKSKVKLSTLRTKLTQEIALLNTQLKSHIQNVKGQLTIMGISAATADQALGGHDVTADLPIISPVSGVVTFRDMTVGERVDPSKRLFSVVDLSPIWIILDVFQEQASQDLIGKSVTITTPSGVELKGTISSIDSNVDAQKKTVQVRVVADNPGGRLRPGTFVQAEIVVGSIESSGVVVPLSAVVEAGDKHFVYTQHESHFDPKEVEVGQQNPSTVEISSGIDVGDMVVVAGAKQLLAQAMLKNGHSNEHGSGHGEQVGAEPNHDTTQGENQSTQEGEHSGPGHQHDAHGAHLASMGHATKPEVLMIMMFLAGAACTSLLGALVLFFRKRTIVNAGSINEVRTKVDA